MKTLLTLCIVCIAVSGCQLDIQGPSMTAKVFYKDENGGDVYKSRGSGMSGGNNYSSDGGRMTSNGDSGRMYRSGNSTDQFCRDFFRTGAKK